MSQITEQERDVSAVRSNRREVRNPILGLPAAALLVDLPPHALQALQAVLGEIATDARRRAQESWQRNKGPMAAYWKAAGAYAEHIRRVLAAERKRRNATPTEEPPDAHT